MSTTETAAKPGTRALQWLGLALTPGLGPTRVRQLVEFFGGADAVFHSSLTNLEAAGLPASAAQTIFTGKALALAEEEFRRASDAGAKVITLDDPLYPQQLKQIYDPPLSLYVRGNPEILNVPGIAVIGTRHPTPYGLGMAERLACDLSARGLIIISGMARGVDSAAHRGVVNAKARTVAVFGTGVDVIYPRENQRLSEQILAFGGALITEFPTGTFAAPQNFPIRNRIISGLSVGVLVIEAAEYSGTRVTARCALEQNRELFAVPGNVTNKNSWGANTLNKQGAKLDATGQDVWEDLPTQIRLQLTPAESATESPGSASLFGEDEKLAPHEKMIFALLKADEAMHIDAIVERVEREMSASEVFAALFELELSGKVRQLPGKNFVKSF